ncbi:MAG: nucleotide exchange factor GrpE, partial [Planctomycetales bacterium]|nr:nucleotide exchange factor GrpE [Planctomycetales bacterium]
ESLAELDESLSRALLSLAQQECSTTTSPDDLLRQFDDTIKRAGTLKRWIAKTAFSAVRQILATASEQLVANAAIQKRTTHGLKLLHERLQRSMQRSELSRLETVGLPFDPERMRAIETVDNSNVPDGHVVDELRPGYRWGNNLLRCADVRIAKST